VLALVEAMSRKLTAKKLVVHKRKKVEMRHAS